MHSEYDFLSTYSRRLRRTAILLMGAGAVLAGAFDGLNHRAAAAAAQQY